MIDGRARVSSIISGNNSVTYTHGTSDELIKKTETKNGNTYTTYYAGGGKYELRIDNNNAETKMLYLGSGVVKYDAPGITDDKILYLLKDHLGSVVKVLSVSGSNVETLESFSYDVWGNRRNATTWANTNITTPTYIFKGFTGHEHIEGFGLIHMKGRVYDPVLGLFLSPDPYVQSSTTMGFNRYSYCMGNPLMYTDPDGKFFGPIIWAGSFLSDIIHYKTSFREAVYNANQIVGELGSAFQYTIFESNNHKVTAGLDIFGLGVSASYSYMWETGSATATAGIGIFGSYYANTNVKQNFITRRGNVFSLNGGVGYGNNNWGWNANAAFNGYGIGYGQTYYGNDIGPDEKRNNQTVGSFTIMGPKGSFNIQNDFLAFGFGRKDRWRSNAVEITIGNFSIGTWLYNNDPSGEGQIRDLDAVNRMGRKNRPIKNANEKDQVGGWPEGKVYASPLYIGLRTGNSISRFGYSSPWVQEFTQNVVHRWFPFGRQNYYTDDSQFIEGVYLYSGHYNPYSIWHPDFNISNNW
jgi:RHS repeat-associated protein